jgi:hypothetical protein
MPGLGCVLFARGIAEADRALPRLAEVHARRHAHAGLLREFRRIPNFQP